MAKAEAAETEKERWDTRCTTSEVHQDTAITNTSMLATVDPNQEADIQSTIILITLVDQWDTVLHATRLLSLEEELEAAVKEMTQDIHPITLQDTTHHLNSMPEEAALQ